MIAPVGASSRSQITGACAGAWLCADAVRAAARDERLVVEVVASIGSTNAALLDRPLDTAHDPVLLVAREQTAGRGRRGRRWFSDPEASLAFSLSVSRRLAADARAPVGLSLAAGVALADALGAHVAGLRLKWPNDLLRGDRKCAGILVESRRTGELERIVFGIGVNLRTPAAADAIAQPVCGVFDGLADVTGDAAPSRERLLGEIAASLLAMWGVFAHDGFAPFVGRWSALDALRDRAVDIVEGERVLMSGRAVGIDDGGALRVHTVHGVQSASVGDVSARRVER